MTQFTLWIFTLLFPFHIQAKQKFKKQSIWLRSPRTKRSLTATGFLLLLLSVGLHAQNRFGATPQINTEFNIGKLVEVDAKVQNRFIFYQNPAGERGNRSGFNHSAIQFVATVKEGLLKSFGAGYQLRWNDDDRSFAHRSIQEYSIERDAGKALLEHRFRTDQTFEKGEVTRYRLRYRLGIEQPLNGIHLDPGEYYLILNNEYVGSIQDGDEHLEIRFLSAIGYNYSDDDQVEAGLDYRAGHLLEKDRENALWIKVGWHHNF